MSVASFALDRFFIKQPTVRRFVTRVAFGWKDKTINLFDLQLRVNSEKENGYLRASGLQRRSSLLRDEVSVLMNICGIIDDGDTFIDIGANIGIFASVVSRASRLKKDVSVIAFEADPKTAARLQINAASNGFTAINAAIAERVGSATFVRGAVSHVTARIDHRSAYSINRDTFKVDCRPLSEFEIPGASLVLKIDVEGMELEVLEGAWPMINRIKAIYFDGVSQQQEIRAKLAAEGFAFYDGRSMLPAGADVFALLAVRGQLADGSIAQ